MQTLSFRHDRNAVKKERKSKNQSSISSEKWKRIFLSEVSNICSRQKKQTEFFFWFGNYSVDGLSLLWFTGEII